MGLRTYCAFELPLRPHFSIDFGLHKHNNYIKIILQALELIEKRFGTTPNLFTTEPEDLDSSHSDESSDWPDNDDVMTEIKK